MAEDLSMRTPIERRALLASLGGALAAVAAGRPAAAQEALGTELSLDEYLRLANPLAAELLEDRSLRGQDRYLWALAALTVRLAGPDAPEFRPSEQGPGASIGFHPGGESFTVLDWRLDPHGEIRPHAHTYGSVVTVLLEGECLLDKYQPVGAPVYEDGATVRLRRSKRQILTPGSVDVVHLDRDCVHGFRAGGQGARGLDVTTRLRPKQPTPYFDVDPAASVDGLTFRATCRMDG